MTTTAEALAGPWAANLRGWAVTTALASLIVVSQEAATPRLDAEWVALSVLVQLVVSTLWAIVVVGISRHLAGRVTPVASGAMWLGIGVLRGIAGGVVAVSAGLDPEWGFRIGFWTLVALCWMPLVTYTLAKWEEHRELLALRADLAAALEEAQKRAAESADERERRMVRAVDDALGAALDEIRWSLRENATLDAPTASRIASRLDELAARTATFTAVPEHGMAPHPGGKVSVRTAAAEFELRRPAFAALLTAAATAPLVLPGAFREGGWPSVAEYAAAILVSTGALAGLYALVRPFLFAGALRSTITRLGVFVAGALGSGAVVALPWEAGTLPERILTLLYPVVFWISAATTGTAVGLAATTAELEAQTDAERGAVSGLEQRVRAAERTAAARLETLVRGDVNGRVASCALALRMLHDGMPADGRERLLDGVLSQLDAAAAELRTR